MLHFSRLAHLHTHTTLLQEILPATEVRIVGGAIRHLLLGISEEVTDIDLTWAGLPDERRDRITLPEAGRGRFRTEKFGTMTLVKKPTEDAAEVSYEITPFREESGYADNRHPDQIVWSHDLLADSHRRDFTINAIYRKPFATLPVNSSSEVVTLKDEKQLLTVLKQHGGCVLIDSWTVILQSPELITHFLEKNTCGNLPYCIGNSKKKDKASLVRTDASSISPWIIIDPHYGLNDLINRKIRAVGNPVDRFTEDALRILRGLRFVNLLNQNIPQADKQNSGFDFDKKTRQAMEHTASLAQELSAERIHAELMKVFSGTNPFGYVSLLREIKLIEYIFPALAKTIDNRQPVRYHPFDTFNHTLLTLRHCQQLCTDPLVKFAMLYHDVGKPEQYAFMDAAINANPDNPDRTGYVAHPEISVWLAKQDFAALAFSSKEIDQICRYIKHHHRPGEILDSKPETWTKKLRELLSEWWFDATIHLLTIAIADRLGQYNPLQKAAISELEQLKTMTADLYATEGRFTMKQLAVNGNDLMQEFSIAPWPELGELLATIFERVITDVTTRNSKEEIYNYLHHLGKNWA
jgi:tRNA nucleotidyltransferase (CCA-adding enzyme)